MTAAFRASCNADSQPPRTGPDAALTLLARLLGRQMAREALDALSRVDVACPPVAIDQEVHGDASSNRHENEEDQDG